MFDAERLGALIEEALDQCNAGQFTLRKRIVNGNIYFTVHCTQTFYNRMQSPTGARFRTALYEVADGITARFGASARISYSITAPFV
jgi:hypothetical protein